MRLREAFRSTGVKLALLWASVFIAISLITGVVAYLLIAEDLDAWLDHSIAETSAYLVQEYLKGGIPAISESVVEHADASDGDDEVFLLVDANGTKVAGNREKFRLIDGWRNADPEEFGLAGDRVFRVYTRQIGSYRLVVANSDSTIDEITDILEKATAVGIVIMVLGALLAGTFIGWRTQKRVERFSTILDAVAHGDLGARVMTSNEGGDDLDHIARGLNGTLDHLSSVITAMQSVTVDIAHDLRSPIARHRNRLAEVLAKPGLSSEVVQDIEGAIGEMDSIVETFDSLLRIAQLESGERLQSFERLDLEQVLQQISDLYLPVAEDAGCALVRSIAPDERPLIVDGDPQLLSQLLINLIENAIRHCPQRTQIVIGAAREEAGIAITVADDGPGIPEGERSRVFERFYRLDRSRGSPGSGLGLALVAAISRLHGAEISILDNEPGLRVRVVFPAAAPF